MPDAPVEPPPPEVSAAGPLLNPPRPKVVLTDEHKERFYTAFLADAQYEEEFALFDGRFRLKFRVITLQQNSDLMRQVSYDRQHDRFKDPNDYYFSRVNHYRLGLSLVQVNNEVFAPGLTPELSPDDTAAGVSYVARRADVFLAWPMPKLAAVQTALAEFDDRVLAMIDAVTKPDFWKAAA